MKIRSAIKADYLQIKKLVASFPEQLMSEIPPVSRFFVAVSDDGKVMGCCALDIYSKRIAEIRSLAVNNKYHSQGIGTKLVARCLNLSQKKGISEVFAITGKIDFFSKFGLTTFQKEKAAVFKRLR